MVKPTVQRRSFSATVVTKQLNVRWPLEQYAAINELALYDSIPMSSVVRMAVADYLRKRNFAVRNVRQSLQSRPNTRQE
jgi:hypothetical protein